MRKILNFTKIVCLLAVLFFQQNVNAQAPNKMSYQSVVRNASNALVANAQVGMKISILQGSASGTALYEESHTATTNTNGLASIEIGSGTVISGTMAGINWANGPYFMKTETDPAGGTAYSINGTSELMSVPYAKFAENSSAWNTASGVTSNNNDNIGIGTTAPNTKLHVSSPQSNVATFNGDNLMWVTLAENGVNRGYIGSYYGNPNDVDFGTYDLNTTGAVHLTTNSLPRLTVANTGNVGIGTSTPDFPFSFPTTYGEKISLWGNASSRVGFAVQPSNFQMLGDVSGTDLTFGYGLSATPTELMRIKSSNGNVGIGTANPSQRLVVKSPKPDVATFDGGNQMWVTLAENGINRGYIGSYAGNPEDVELGTYDINTTGSVHLTTNNTPRLTAVSNGNVGVGTTAPTTMLEVNGGTKLGSNAPAIKMIKFTGTTGASQGASANVPLGFDDVKVLSVNVLVEYGASAGKVPPSYTVNPGYEYNYYVQNDSITVWLKSGNSANILNQPFTIFVTYEE